MAAPGILTGGQRAEIFAYQEEAAETRSLRQSQGVFAENPGATPKWAFNDPSRKRDAEYRETMARLFIEIPPEARETFLQTISPDTQDLAEALMSGGSVGGSGGTGFIDFLMTNVQESFQEKVQIVDTLTDNYVVYFSGREPMSASYAGTFLNTFQDDQRVWFFRLYHEVLRGTRLAARNLVARLRYDSFLITGYLTNLIMLLDGETDHTAARFNFEMIIKRIQVVTPPVCAPTGLPPLKEPLSESMDELVNGALDALTARYGELTSEVPPTATEGPATEVLAANQTQSIREKLRAAGKSDVEINQILFAAQNMSAGGELDPREEKYLLGFEGVDRAGPQSLKDANPENKQNDGLGGATNMTMPVDPGQFLLVENQMSSSEHRAF